MNNFNRYLEIVQTPYVEGIISKKISMWIQDVRQFVQGSGGAKINEINDIFSGLTVLSGTGVALGGIYGASMPGNIIAAIGGSILCLAGLGNISTDLSGMIDKFLLNIQSKLLSVEDMERVTYEIDNFIVRIARDKNIAPQVEKLKRKLNIAIKRNDKNMAQTAIDDFKKMTSKYYDSI